MQEHCISCDHSDACFLRALSPFVENFNLIISTQNIVQEEEYLDMIEVSKQGWREMHNELYDLHSFQNITEMIILKRMERWCSMQENTNVQSFGQKMP
jgi:hypothetical protein